MVTDSRSGELSVDPEPPGIPELSRRTDLMWAMEAAEACAKAAGGDVTFGSDADVLEALRELSRAASLVDVALAKLIDRAGREDLTIADCGLKVPSWIARHTKAPVGPCRKQAIRARTAVMYFGRLVDAASTAEINWNHVELVAAVSNVRNRDLLGQVQGDLIEAAKELSWPDYERLVRQIANAADVDGGYDPNDDLCNNRLKISELPEGTKDLTARLVGDAAITVEATIEEIADELFRTYKRDNAEDPELPIPSRNTLRALALAEACRRARAVDLNSTAPVRPEAVIVIEEDTTTGKATATDIQGRQIPQSALDVMLGDAAFRGLLLDGKGATPHFGRERRLASEDQRKVLAVRDGSCVFAGCDAPPGWCDAHHVIQWTKGGLTDIELLALLCRHHHRLTHGRGWEVRPRGAPGEFAGFERTTPSGKKILSQHRRPVG